MFATFRCAEQVTRLFSLNKQTHNKVLFLQAQEEVGSHSNLLRSRVVPVKQFRRELLRIRLMDLRMHLSLLIVSGSARPPRRRRSKCLRFDLTQMLYICALAAAHVRLCS